VDRPTGRKEIDLDTPTIAPRGRVNEALAFRRPDRTPRDFAAVPEIWQGLGRHFGTHDRNEILRQLGVDCRVVSYDSFCRSPEVAAEQVDMDASQERSSVGGMWRRVEPDGSNRDIWGAHRARVANAFGVLEQFVSFPLQSAQSVEDLKRYRWPAPDWWDFRPIRAAIAELNRRPGSRETDPPLPPGEGRGEIVGTRYHIRYRLGSVFETAWSLYGFERMLMDLAASPAMPAYVMERIAEVHLENLHVVLETTGDLIDLVYFYDDVASQEGLLMSPALYEQRLQPFHQRIIDLASRYGKPVMMHSCGSVYRLIPRLIDMGLAVLNPIQPSARWMEPERLAAEFGGRLAFHGGIDVQQFLPRATPSEVRDKVARTCEVLGHSGGYILAGSHHIQADTPIENVLAVYQS
jgi:uroporphyrinogen decarboxylase